MDFLGLTVPLANERPYAARARHARHECACGRLLAAEIRVVNAVCEG